MSRHIKKEKDRNSDKGEKKKKRHSSKEFESSASSHALDSNSRVSNDAITELRLRRLQREKEERKRANVLLASVDIYGPSSKTSLSKVVDGARYHQQYNPHLSKEKFTVH